MKVPPKWRHLQRTNRLFLIYINAIFTRRILSRGSTSLYISWIYFLLVWAESHLSIEKTRSSILLFERPKNEASEIWPAPLLRDQSSCKSFCLALSKIFPDPLYGKMEWLHRSKDSFINRDPVRTTQKSHSWSHSNGQHNPLPVSFSEHGMLDPVFSRDQWPKAHGTKETVTWRDKICRVKFTDV